MDEYLQAPDMPNIGSVIPQNTTSQEWECRRDDRDLICLYDGQHVFTFRGQLHLTDQTYIEKSDDLPFAQFNQLDNKCAATVHRSSPGGIRFTLNDGRFNQTYTFRHSSGTRWAAVPKPRRRAEQGDVADQR